VISTPTANGCSGVNRAGGFLLTGDATNPEIGALLSGLYHFNSNSSWQTLEVFVR
jgi:hypothetical protein